MSSNKRSKETGFSTHEKKRKKARIVKQNQRESEMYDFVLCLEFHAERIFRGPKLKQYFKEKEWDYISHPTFYEWKITKEESTVLGTRRINSPREYFDLMFNREIYQHIVRLSFKKFSSDTKEELNPKHIRKFFGSLFIRGVYGLRNMKYLWKKEGLTIEFPGKKNQLNKNDWYFLSNNMKFDISMIHSILIKSFKKHLIPGYFICIDEIRIPAHHFECENKTYNLHKPDNWAIESKCINDSSGYLLDMINPYMNDKPTPKEAAKKFIQDLKGDGRRHHVTLDSNFFSATDGDFITNLKYEFTLSCQSNRPSWLWKEGLQVNLPKGYTRVAKKDYNLAVCTYNSGRLNLLTTYYHCEDCEETYQSKDRRDPMKHYDATKGYSDKFGHLVKAYFIGQRSNNPELTLLIGWAQYAITNAYILYKLDGYTTTHEGFITEVALSLLNYED